MSCALPKNSELKSFESLLDFEMEDLQGSAIWDKTNNVYEDLDNAITLLKEEHEGVIEELKRRIGDLEDERDELQESIELKDGTIVHLEEKLNDRD